ncbi:Zinc ion binding protein [Phytophthora megakarya]|uniref:Zinc ion binding protein n=1 Tax=Phytophthora megakarya TaxID=4795 RepID=A0A225W619_9STRA|nr:Zinc ion binding protein [Phytophthora megakarya]
MSTKTPLPPTSCHVCGPRPNVSPDSLFKCSRCKAVLYCGRGHQTSDFREHKDICKRVKKMRDLMAEEAHKIRNAEEDDWAPANAFEEGVGHFWGIHSTRPYMRAKLEVIRALSIMVSRTAVEAALAEALDCLRLCRGDNMGIREVIPTLYLLLDQYQEAYDFIKWYATSGQDMHYDWGDMDLPFLDVHGADMTEELPYMRDNVFFSSCIVYIKMMLTKTVKDAITAHELADRASLPTVVTDSLGAFLTPNGQARSLADLKKLHKKLERQLDEAFTTSNEQNPHFFPTMLDPMPLVEAPDAPYYAPGDANQVKIWAKQNFFLWVRYHDFIREKLGK